MQGRITWAYFRTYSSLIPMPAVPGKMGFPSWHGLSLVVVPRLRLGWQTREYDILFTGRGAYAIFLHTLQEIAGYSHVIYWKHVTVICNFPAAKRACFGELSAGVWWRMFFLNLSHLVQKRSTQSFKIEIKTRKKELSIFWKLKNIDSFKSYKDFKLNDEKA